MSRSSVEQALSGLIPTMNGPLPPELIDLALSLLARSRSVANSLKSDEEIARPYACAQLACERLKKRFNLPTIASRPPCPPRIYKKLYNYLNSALPAPVAAREPQTPSKRTTSAPVSARNTPKTPLSGRKTPHSGRRENGTISDVPEWVMPAIRSLLKAFDFPSAAPNVFTGVESILPILARMSVATAETPSKRARKASSMSQLPPTTLSNARILALIAAIFLYVYTKMKNVEVTPEQYKSWKDTAISTLLALPIGQDVTPEDLSLEVEEMLPMAQAEGWLRMEWFMNVVPEETEDMEGVEATSSANSRVAGSGGMRSGGSDYIGLGTMMQDATDYLGERQKQDYKQWKARILARVEEIEAA